ncbi:MAG: tetratricopeptide repeat protein [Methylotenera sp.]
MPTIKENIESNVTDDILDTLFTQALQRHQQEDWQAAEDFYRKILAVLPEQPNVNYNLGMLKLQCNQVDASLPYLKQALTADQSQPKYWLSYVQALMQSNQKKLAVDTLMKGLEYGLHGEEVNALVEALVKTAPSAPASSSGITIVNQAGSALTARKNAAPELVSKAPGKHLQHYLEDPKIQKVLLVQQSGRIKQAKKQWLQLLKYYPKHPVILTCLGTIALETGQVEDAVKWLSQSLEILPQQASALSYMSIARLQMKQFDDALRYADKAIEINPDYMEAHANRGAILKELKRYDQAIASYQKALALSPSNPDTLFNMSLVYLARGNYIEATNTLKQMLTIKPNDATAQHLCGEIHKELKLYTEALSYFDVAIRLNNRNEEAYFGRGVAYLALKKFESARADFSDATRLKPSYCNAYINLGISLRHLGYVEDALDAYDQALRLNNQNPDIFNNKGLLLVDMRRFDEALDCYQQAIALAPDFDEVYWNQSHFHLLLGDYEQGWPLYEYRWKSVQKSSYRSLNKPLWLGEESIVGKTLLIYPEQGQGDFIQFFRYVAEVEKLGAKVILEVPPSLMALVKEMHVGCLLIKSGDIVHDYDYHCPIMSLPLAFKTELDTVPNNIPYLKPNPTKVDKWQSLVNRKVFNIGLVWSGASGHQHDHLRSIALEKLKPIMTLPAEFHAIQKEIRETDQQVMKQIDNLKTYQSLLNDFSETAALIAHMDLVITVDTSVAHLAGAMGKACWLLLPYSPDFRWLLGRSDSPWYSTMTLFRQPTFNDWDSVIAILKQQLLQKIQSQYS